jgi:hypothetical protein
MDKISVRLQKLFLYSIANPETQREPKGGLKFGFLSLGKSILLTHFCEFIIMFTKN